jgi:hypothetical protein
VPVTGGAATIITKDQRGADANPVYSPDGKMIVYSSQERPGFESDEGRLMAYDRASNTSHRLASGWDRNADSYFFSSSGDAIYIVTTDASREKIYRLTRNAGWGTTPQLIVGTMNNASPVLSSDGNTMVWLRDAVDHPVSLYAATKKANELMAHTYSHLYALPTTGLRFFPVYGPWGRPDMALFLFTKKILAGEPIEVFNHGRHSRDFTYIDDIVEGVIRTLDHVPAGDTTFDPLQPNPGSSNAPYRVYNIGNHAPVELTRYIEAIESAVGRKAEKILKPLQPGDVPDTYADVSELMRDVDYAPSTPIEVGIPRFVEWYRSYFGQA